MKPINKHIYSMYQVDLPKLSIDLPEIVVSFRLKLKILNNDYSYKNILKNYDEKNIIVYNNVKLFNDDNDDVMYVEEPVVILDYCGSYHHFIVDTLGKLFYIKKYFPNVVPFFVIPDYDQKSQNYINHINKLEDILKELDIEYSKINLTNIHKTFIFNTVYSITPEPIINYQYFKYNNDILMQIRNQFIPKKQLINNKNIFISRKNYYEQRIFNISEIEKELAKNNFETVFLEDLTFRDQVNLFYNTKNIIAITGSSLVNLLFSNENCNILSVHNKPGYFAEEYSLFAELNNINYNDMYIKDINANKILKIFNLLKK